MCWVVLLLSVRSCKKSKSKTEENLLGVNLLPVNWACRRWFVAVWSGRRAGSSIDRMLQVSLLPGTAAHAAERVHALDNAPPGMQE